MSFHHLLPEKVPNDLLAHQFAQPSFVDPCEWENGCRINTSLSPQHAV
jgi:hypothetical protein